MKLFNNNGTRYNQIKAHTLPARVFRSKYVVLPSRSKTRFQSVEEIAPFLQAHSPLELDLLPGVLVASMS